MRTFIQFILLLIFAAVFQTGHAGPEEEGKPGEQSVRIICGEDLAGIARVWADGYEKFHSTTRVMVSVAGQEEIKQKLSEKGIIGLLSSEYIGGIRGTDCKAIVVGRDILVPVVNSGNPFLEQVFREGLSPGDFGRAYSERRDQTWGTLLGDGNPTPVSTCVVAATTGISGLAEFLQVDQDLLQGCLVKDREEFKEMIRGNKYSLGFCRLCDIVSCETGGLEEGLALVPIDANGNGTIDPFETIYQSASDLARGVWIGKYPGMLFSRIYAVMDETGAGDAELAFLEWALSDGQTYLAGAGLNGLLASERRVSIDRIRDLRVPPAELSSPIAQSRTFFLALAVLAGLILFWLIARTFRRRSGSSEVLSAASGGSFGENNLSVPQGLFFDRSHTWVFMEKDGEVRVGLDDFITHVTGTVTRIKMKGPGDRVKKGEAFLTLVQNGKQMTIHSPVSGVVGENNNRLSVEPGLVNRDPLSDGWIYKIRPAKWMEEIKSYFMGENYREWIGEEFRRLRDFLASILVPVEGKEKHEPVLQDGGEIRDGVLEYFGPPVWEDFQSKFINPHNRKQS